MSVEDEEIHKIINVTFRVTKTVFPHFISKQDVIRTHLRIQISYYDRNVIFKKPLLGCIELLTRNILLFSVSEASEIVFGAA